MNKQGKLAELHSIRTTLDKVAKSYCATSEERKTVKEISMRLFTEQILPLAEELTAELVKDTEKLVANNAPSGVQLINLGLPSGTLWTDRNLGADAPEKAGDYFRFGETTPFTGNSPKYKYDDIDSDIAETDRDAVLELSHLDLGLDRRVSLKSCDCDQIHIVESQLCEFHDLRLNEQVGLFGIKSDRKVIERYLNDIFTYLLRIVHVVCQSLRVCYHDINFIKLP